MRNGSEWKIYKNQWRKINHAAHWLGHSTASTLWYFFPSHFIWGTLGAATLSPHTLSIENLWTIVFGILYIIYISKGMLWSKGATPLDAVLSAANKKINFVVCWLKTFVTILVRKSLSYWVGSYFASRDHSRQRSVKWAHSFIPNAKGCCGLLRYTGLTLLIRTCSVSQ